VLHRDIKLDNVLMDGDGGVKLCDFGVSRLMKKGASVQEQCGTPAYLAPEIILDRGY
jgi:serine/threonine protein kinase